MGTTPLAAIVALVTLGQSVVNSANTVSDMDSARNYLKKYFIGPQFYSSDIGNMDSEQEMTNTLSSYQRFFGLSVTGTLNQETMEMMSKPRCGRPDFMTSGDDFKRRKKRYTLLGQKWGKTSLTYYIQDYSTDLRTGLQDQILSDAFKVWSDETSLTFQRVYTSNADIIIFFTHDDRDAPFDGPGGTLAHAYAPGLGIGGDAHFDEAETWTHGTSSGVNLFQVAVHEFGHSLGLGHSQVRDAIMYPSYNGYVPNFELDQDDINGITSLYGGPETVTPRPPRPTDRPTQRPTPGPTARPTPGNPLKDRFCQDLHFDAITLFGEDTFAFKDDLVAMLVPDGIADGFPMTISDYFHAAPNNIDAALYWPHNSPPRLYLFKGNRYWRYNLWAGGQLARGYPKNIGTGFPSLPNNVDSAFVWGRNGRSYVMKGDDYYRLGYDPETMESSGTVDDGYPRHVDVWRFPDDNYSAMFQWTNGRTYLFREDEYTRIDDFRLGADTNTEYPYPRKIDDWWTFCDVNKYKQSSEMTDDGDGEFVIVSGGVDGGATSCHGGGHVVGALLVAAAYFLLSTCE